MKSLLPKLKVLLANLGLFLVLLEIGSLALFYWKSGEFFYRRNKSADIFASQIAGLPAQTSNEVVVFRLHPFFGYTFEPGSHPNVNAPAANNHGFVSSYDYPFKRQNENQFIIGVFGGSLAHLFSLYETEHKTLTETLHHFPDLQHKEIIVLNFGGLGYKQPQQAIVLNYFLSLGQDLDMVINIDGFNEIAFSVINSQHGVEISMPSSQTQLPLIDIISGGLSSKQVELSLEMLHDSAGLRKSLAEAKASILASGYVLAVLRIVYYSKMYQRHQNQFNDLVKMGQKQKRETGDDAVCQKASEIWANSSISMKDVLSRHKVAYFHFLEPNQHFATARKFTEEEKRIALNPEGGFARSISKGYPFLISQLDNLRSADVKVFNGVNIFDNISESVYSDQCCHYNDRGNQILAQFVADSIEQAWSQRARGSSRN